MKRDIGRSTLPPDISVSYPLFHTLSRLWIQLNIALSPYQAAHLDALLQVRHVWTCGISPVLFPIQINPILKAEILASLLAYLGQNSSKAAKLSIYKSLAFHHPKYIFNNLADHQTVMETSKNKSSASLLRCSGKEYSNSRRHLITINFHYQSFDSRKSKYKKNCDWNWQ